MSHNPKYYVQYLKRNKVKSSDIRFQTVVKEEKIFRRKYNVSTLTDIATVDFGCASSSSQLKKTILSK